MLLALIGLSHHTASIEIRERLSYAEHTPVDALTALAACPSVREAALLSTCNRMEMAVVAESDAGALFSDLCRHLAQMHQTDESVFRAHLYCKTEHEAASHLMRVASGLDSLVLGEAQILGQVRTALRAAQAAGTVGGVLTALFQQAIACGKRVQTETGLGRGTFSIGHAAVDLAAGIFADLSHASVLILGAGKMSELTARHLIDSGVRFVVVANRTYEKAADMAARFGGKAIRYDDFPEALVTADIVISSTAAPHPIVRRETLLPVLRRRRGKPLFLIDIAVPRDIDPDVARLDNVFLKNIDDLEDVVANEAGGRAAEAVRAEAVVADEAAKFLAWYRTREAAPVIGRLRERLEQLRQDELELLRSQLGPLSERDWQRIEAAMRSLTNKIAREPILRLKRAAEDTPTVPDAEAMRYDLHAAALELFGLETTVCVESPLETAPLSPASDNETFSSDKPAEKAPLLPRQATEAPR